MSNPIKLSCESCYFFIKQTGQRRGDCYLNPPIPFATGEQRRPQVFGSDLACSHHKALPEGEKPITKEKLRPVR